MSLSKMLGAAALASTVLLVGCGEDEKAPAQSSAPVVEESTTTEAPAQPSSMDKLKQEAGETLQAAGEVAREAGEEVRKTASDVGEKAAEVGSQLKEDAAKAYEQAESGARELGDKAVEKAAELEQAARAQLEANQQQGEPEVVEKSTE